MNVRRLGVLAVVATVVLWGGAAAATASHATATPTTSTPATATNASTATVQEANATVAMDDQTVEDGTVTVQSVTLPEGGYVTIHDDTLFEGDALGSVVGVSEYLEAGYYEGLTVTLDEELTADDTLIAMPHLETTGDETYDFVTSEGEDDGPYTVDGQPVTAAANVTVA